MQNLALVGLSHRTAPVEIRERVAFPEGHMGPAVRALIDDFDLTEGMIVSTCNRVEMVALGKQEGAVTERLREFLCTFHSIGRAELDPYLYSMDRRTVVEHLFRVASSLDSMVVGEPQILSQLKQSFHTARQVGSIGTHLNRLVPRAFFVAKRVRTETRIAESPVSVSSVAVDLARKIFGDLKNKSALLIGAGKMGQLAVRSLVDSGVSEVFVSNRTPDRGYKIAEAFHGVFIPLDKLDDYLVRADIILASTASTKYLLDRQRLSEIIKKRKYRPLFIIDISVPRNVEPSVNEIENIFLYDVDDLQSVVDLNINHRRREAEQAEQIVMEEVDHYLERVSVEQVGPLVSSLRHRVENICLEDLQRERTRLTPDEFERLERLLRRAAHRLAHPMIQTVKQQDDNSVRKFHNLEMIRRMFELGADEE